MDDPVFGPAVVKGHCLCKVCGRPIFMTDVAPTRWDEPREFWCHYEDAGDHLAEFGCWVPGD